MPLFDAHCHLDFPVFDEDRDQVLQRARAAGVKSILLPGTVADTWPNLLRVAGSAPDLHPCLGLHPLFMSQHASAHLEQLADLLRIHPEVVAVGEIGIDFWTDELKQQAQQQWQLLDAQLDLAVAFDLPVVLHVRKGMDLLIQRLRRKPQLRGGLVHAFSGSLQQARQLVELGFRIGVGGALTYPRAQRLRQVVAALPLSSLLLETDSPDMPLAGFQDQRNEPARIPLVFAALQAIRPEPVEQLMSSLSDNLLHAFPRIKWNHA